MPKPDEIEVGGIRWLYDDGDLFWHADDIWNWVEAPNATLWTALKAQAEVAALRAQREGIWADLIEQRIGESAPCSKCRGLGVRAYSSTAIWRGGVGGQAITGGICDACWGSGTEERPGVDLRKHEAAAAYIAKLEAEVTRLREALRRYDQHEPNCRWDPELGYACSARHSQTRAALQAL